MFTVIWEFTTVKSKINRKIIGLYSSTNWSIFMFSKRTINFDCNFTIESLEEVPIKASDVQVHWTFKENGFSLFKTKLNGKTEGKQIQDNRVEWKQPFKITISIPVNSKTNELEHAFLNFQILSKKTVHTQVGKLKF